MRGLIRLGRTSRRRSEGEVLLLVDFDEDERDGVDDDEVDDDEEPGVLDVEGVVVSRLRCPWTNRVRVVLTR